MNSWKEMFISVGLIFGAVAIMIFVIWLAQEIYWLGFKDALGSW